MIDSAITPFSVSMRCTGTLGLTSRIADFRLSASDAGSPYVLATTVVHDQFSGDCSADRNISERGGTPRPTWRTSPVTPITVNVCDVLLGPGSSICRPSGDW